jgi:hypothetical protein
VTEPAIAPPADGKLVDSMPTIDNEFEIVIGEKDEPWHAANGMVSVTVFPSEANKEPSKDLNGVPALIWKHNAIHGFGTPAAYKSQWLVCEVNSVFFHLRELEGKVTVMISDRRLT